MADWKKRIGAINLIVGDLDRCAAFYTDVFVMAPLHQDEDTAIFRFEDTYLFLQRGQAHEDAPAGEVLDLAEKGIGQFAIIVDDVDAVRAELAKHDVTAITDPADRDWGMRTMTFADPGGYIWEIAQELPDAPSSA